MTQHNLMLNCVPIINLFTKISEPIKLSDKESGSTINCGQKKDSYTEIHSIDALLSLSLEVANQENKDFSTVT